MHPPPPLQSDCITLASPNTTLMQEGVEGESSKMDTTVDADSSTALAIVVNPIMQQHGQVITSTKGM